MNVIADNRRIVFLFLGLGIANISIWISSYFLYSKYLPNKTYLLVISYLLGLRHSLDADHIIAIDNVTNRMVQNGERPILVGLFFSLGHSTIVILAIVLIIIFSVSFRKTIVQYNTISGIIGTSISGSFLIIISIMNGVYIYSIYTSLKRLRAKENAVMVEDICRIENHEIDTHANDEENVVDDYDDEINRIDNADVNDIENRNDKDVTFELFEGGLINRVIGNRLFVIVNKSWKMYIVGFLFGLGFDTATEISLLGIAALESLRINFNWLIICLPLLFTCGMCLIDTIDGVIVSYMYIFPWLSNAKKAYYSLIFTTISFQFAAFFGIVEILSVFQEIYYKDSQSLFWKTNTMIQENASFTIGIVLIGTFLSGWAISYLIRLSL